MGDDDVVGEIELPNAGMDVPDSKTKGKRRVQRACDSCRRKKVKCEDTRPCSRCIEDGDECQSSLVMKQQVAGSAGKETRGGCPVCENSTGSSPRPCWRCVITGNVPVDEFNISAAPDAQQDKL
eukprot:768590-Hanusia_phi.AAC.15